MPKRTQLRRRTARLIGFSSPVRPPSGQAVNSQLADVADRGIGSVLTANAASEVACVYPTERELFLLGLYE